MTIPAHFPGRGLQIGSIRLATPLLLAPIAGYCDLAFRTVCREQGGLGLACTDLLSPQGLLRGTATSLDLASTNDADKPVGMQLYGSDPEIMAEGARWAVEHGATIVDINMGCPVDKVTKKDGGSKLLTDLSRAVAIAARVVKELEKCPLSAGEWGRRLGNARHVGLEARQSGMEGGHSAFGIRHSAQEQGATLGADARSTNGPGRIPNASSAHASSSDASSPDTFRAPVPLTCKMRLCWSTSDYEAGQACSPHLARMLADVGVAAVTVHGRTTEMKFSGVVQHAGIARVVEAVDGAIPVIGNGDVRTPEDARRMFELTGCSGVMIGRGALSTPWLFRDCWAHLRGEAVPAEPSEAEKIAIMRRYFALMREFRGDHYAMSQMRKRISWFAKRLVAVDPASGRPIGCKPLKEAIRTAAGPGDVLSALERFLAGGLRGMPGQDVEAEEAGAA